MKKGTYGKTPGGQPCINLGNNLAPGFDGIASGYWTNFNERCLPPLRVGGCLHGPPHNNDCGGLNKDTSFRTGFVQARDLAVEATLDYVGQIVFEILGSTELAIDEKNKALRALLDKPETFKCTEECIPPYI